MLTQINNLTIINPKSAQYFIKSQSKLLSKQQTLSLKHCQTLFEKTLPYAHDYLIICVFKRTTSVWKLLVNVADQKS